MKLRKQYRTCNPCKACEQEFESNGITFKYVCKLGFKIGWAGNPLEPCPKPKTKKEYADEVPICRKET